MAKKTKAVKAPIAKAPRKTQKKTTTTTNNTTPMVTPTTNANGEHGFAALFKQVTPKQVRFCDATDSNECVDDGGASSSLDSLVITAPATCGGEVAALRTDRVDATDSSGGAPAEEAEETLAPLTPTAAFDACAPDGTVAGATPANPPGGDAWANELGPGAWTSDHRCIGSSLEDEPICVGEGTLEDEPICVACAAIPSGEGATTTDAIAVVVASDDDMEAARECGRRARSSPTSDVTHPDDVDPAIAAATAEAANTDAIASSVKLSDYIALASDEEDMEAARECGRRARSSPTSDVTHPDDVDPVAVEEECGKRARMEPPTASDSPGANMEL